MKSGWKRKYAGIALLAVLTLAACSYEQQLAIAESLNRTAAQEHERVRAERLEQERARRLAQEQAIWQTQQDPCKGVVLGWSKIGTSPNSYGIPRDIVKNGLTGEIRACP